MADGGHRGAEAEAPWVPGAAACMNQTPLRAESLPVLIESSPGNKLDRKIIWELKQAQGALVIENT